MENVKERSLKGGVTVDWTDGFGVQHANCFAYTERNTFFTDTSLRIQVDIYANIEAYQNYEPMITTKELVCESTQPEWVVFSDGALLSDILGYIQATINAGGLK